MIDYAEIKPGDKLRITGMGAPGFAKLGDVVTVVKTNGTTRCDVRHDETGDEVFFALTCGAQRLEKIETTTDQS
jgi:hypothetical protein